MVDIVLLDEARARGDRVRFRTEVGDGLGVWMVDHAVGRGKVNVEFAVDDAVRWSDVRVTAGPTALSIVGSAVRVTGLVLGVQDDIVDLQVGSGLLMLEVLGEPTPDVVLGRYLEVRVPPMGLYLTGI